MFDDGPRPCLSRTLTTTAAQKIRAAIVRPGRSEYPFLPFHEKDLAFEVDYLVGSRTNGRNENYACG